MLARIPLAAPCAGTARPARSTCRPPNSKGRGILPKRECDPWTVICGLTMTTPRTYHRLCRTHRRRRRSAALRLARSGPPRSSGSLSRVSPRPGTPPSLPRLPVSPSPRLPVSPRPGTPTCLRMSAVCIIWFPPPSPPQPIFSSRGLRLAAPPPPPPPGGVGSTGGTACRLTCSHPSASPHHLPTYPPHLTPSPPNRTTYPPAHLNSLPRHSLTTSPHRLPHTHLTSPPTNLPPPQLSPPHHTLTCPLNPTASPTTSGARQDHRAVVGSRPPRLLDRKSGHGFGAAA